MYRNEKKETSKAYILYILSLLIFGTNGILVSNINLESSQIVFLRTLLGGLLLTFFVIIRGGFDLNKIKKEKNFLILGGISLGLNWAMLFSGYKLLNVSLATLIYYGGPIIVLVLSPVLFKEKMTFSKILSAFIVVIGIFLISGSVIRARMSSKGLVFAFLSALFYAMVIVFNKKISLTSSLQVAAIELDIAFLLMLVYLFLTTGFPKIQRVDLPQIFVIGFINTGLAYLLYFSSLKYLSSQSLALLSYIDPVSALIFSSIFLNEVMTPVQVIGSILVIGGAVFGELWQDMKK